jgi:hypothetical protein
MIIVKENAFWAAYVEGNTSDLSKLLLPGFVNVEEQIQNREQVLEFVKEFHSHCTLAPVKILDPSVSFLGPEVATIVYHSVEAPTCGTQTASGETNVSSVWLHRDGRWQMHLHTEHGIHSRRNPEPRKPCQAGLNPKIETRKLGTIFIKREGAQIVCEEPCLFQ